MLVLTSDGENAVRKALPLVMDLYKSILDTGSKEQLDDSQKTLILLLLQTGFLP